MCSGQTRIMVYGGPLMFAFDDLAQQVNACQHGASVDDFEDWFRANSAGAYLAHSDLRQAFFAIESAFSKLRFQNIGEEDFRRELANAIRPLAVTQYASSNKNVPVLGEPLVMTTSTSRSIHLEGHRRPSWLLAFPQSKLEFALLLGHQQALIHNTYLCVSQRDLGLSLTPPLLADSLVLVPSRT
jgi:hypothetical protein